MEAARGKTQTHTQAASAPCFTNSAGVANFAVPAVIDTRNICYTLQQSLLICLSASMKVDLVLLGSVSLDTLLSSQMISIKTAEAIETRDESVLLLSRLLPEESSDV